MNLTIKSHAIENVAKLGVFWVFLGSDGVLEALDL